MKHGDNHFLDGLSHDGQLFGIVDMCKDASGRVDFANVEAMALATGHHNYEDIGMLDALVRSNNAEASAAIEAEVEDWHDGCELGNELGVDPDDYDSAEEYSDALSEAAEDAGFDSDAW